MTHRRGAPNNRPGMGLIGRLIGVIVAPRRTFEVNARHPRWLGALLTVALIIAGASSWLVSTELGQQMQLEQQVDAMDSFGVTVSEEIYDQLKRRLASAVCLTAGVVWTVGYVGLGGGSSLRAIFAVVVHTGAISIVQQMFVIPLNYARGAMGNPTTLAAFVPMLEEGPSRPARSAWSTCS